MISKVKICEKHECTRAICLANGKIFVSFGDKIAALDSKLKIIKILQYHKSYVNALTTLEDNYFCSCDDDGLIVVFFTLK